MASNEVVGIDIVARLDDFRSELAKIPDIGAREAKALTSQLSREIKSMERASKKAADQSKKTADALKRQARASRDLGREVADATSSIESMVADIKSTGDAIVSIELLKQAFQLLRDGIRATVERAMKLDQQMGGQLTPSIDEAKQAISDLADAGVEPLIPALTMLAQGIADVAGGAAIAARELFGLSDATNAVRAAQDAANDAIDEQDRRYQDAQRAVSNLTERLAAYRASGEATAEGIRTYEEAIREASAEMDRQRGVLRRLSGELARDRVVRKERAEEDTAAVEQIVENVRREESAIAQLAKTRRQAYIEEANQRQKAADKAIEEANRAKQAQIDAWMEERRALEWRMQAERDLRASVATTAIETADDVANSVIDALERVALENVEEATKRRDVEIGLAILRGELQAAAAFGTTLATYGGTPQGFALAAAAAGAVGGSSKAAAAAGAAGSAEKFHAGGVSRDEGVNVIRAGEGVVTPGGLRKLGGEAGLREVNSGAGGGMDDGSRSLIIGGRAYDAMTTDALSRRGSVLSRSLDSLRRRPGSHRPHG